VPASLSATAPRSLAAASRFNLTAALALVALCELVYHRVGAQLYLPYVGLSRNLNVGLEGLSTFVSHLAGLLGLLVLLNTLLVKDNRRHLFPVPMRVALIVVSAFFFFFAIRGVVGQLGERTFTQLKIGHMFLSLFLLAGLWVGNNTRDLDKGSDSQTYPKAGLRGRMAATALILPFIANTLAFTLGRFFWTHTSSASRAAQNVAEISALVAPGAAFLLIAGSTSRNRKHKALAAVTGIVFLTVGFALTYSRFDLLQTVILHGFRLQLPVPQTPVAQLLNGLFVISLAACVYATILLLCTGRAARLSGYGLVLVLCGGFQATSALHLVLSLCGLFALCLGVKKMPDQSAP